ncbi:hypothetical protein [Alkaliphilus sp. B6464]|uniref:hypothetical protein n=1 Tax=Alkaliphilus sp. B6464 TaxID=2731219 RepID=UPI001BA43DBD|nr:hypothetical protein [Alkaliphilus sp. B6464]QUH21480.1 hypothetical protein HYG84_17385 [Alkaliphilus sp. B6464]
MKKIFSIFLVLILMVSMLAGCTPKNTSSNETPPAENTSPNENKPVEDTSSNDGNIVKIGLGHSTSIGKSKDLAVDKDGKDILPVGQVDTVIAAVGFDKDGKVVKVTIDTAQTKVNFDKDLKVTSDLTAVNKTKVELKDDYGMVKASEIKKEWYQQIEELEKWMIGKTVDEIKSMKVKERDESHKSVPDVPELTSLVTVTVEGYIAAVEEAYKTAVEIGSGAETLGLGHEISIGKSKGLEVKDGKETLPAAQVDTVMAATAFDEDGKVVGTIIDNAQTKVEFDNKGIITTDKNTEIKTKVELGDAYGMKKASTIGKEWFEQIAEFEKWMVGKSVDEIKALKVKERDASHKHVPDIPELTSTVTVTVEGYIAAVAEAYANAK